MAIKLILNTNLPSFYTIKLNKINLKVNNKNMKYMPNESKRNNLL